MHLGDGKRLEPRAVGDPRRLLGDFAVVALPDFPVSPQSLELRKKEWGWSTYIMPLTYWIRACIIDGVIDSISAVIAVGAREHRVLLLLLVLQVVPDLGAQAMVWYGVVCYSMVWGYGRVVRGGGVRPMTKMRLRPKTKILHIYFTARHLKKKQDRALPWWW